MFPFDWEAWGDRGRSAKRKRDSAQPQETDRPYNRESTLWARSVTAQPLYGTEALPHV